MLTSTVMSLSGVSSLMVPLGDSVESLEAAGRLLEKHLYEDNSFMELSGQLRIATHGTHKHL